jgi:hypothetical protein
MWSLLLEWKTSIFGHHLLPVNSRLSQHTGDFLWGRMILNHGRIFGKLRPPLLAVGISFGWLHWIVVGQLTVLLVVALIILSIVHYVIGRMKMCNICSHHVFSQDKFGIQSLVGLQQHTQPGCSKFHWVVVLCNVANWKATSQGIQFISGVGWIWKHRNVCVC